MSLTSIVSVTDCDLEQVSNQEFLQKLFGAYLDQDHHAWVCAFSVDPEKGPWRGNVWKGDDLPLQTSNTFFSIGLIKTDAKGHLARKKANFAALPCVMLDDIGTKADELQVPPTWKIETSPGNFQAGYAFLEPIEDVATAEAFLKALAIAGRLTDSGGQNVCRYARLPVGANTKAKYGSPPPRLRLVVWEPDRRYHWQDLAEQLGLDLEAQVPKRKRKKADGRSLEDDAIFVPKANDNPVIVVLKERGLYKAPLGSGKHDVTCPWVCEHTDQVNQGSAYFEPDDAHHRGGYSCLHDHCTGRGIGALLANLGVPDLAAKHKPVIRLSGGTLHIVVAHAERILAEAGHYYQQGGAILKVATPPGAETTTRSIKPAALTVDLTRHATWLQCDRRLQDWSPVDAPQKVCNAVADLTEYRYLPPLLAIARQPYLRPDGTIANEAGYDRPTFIFGAFNATEYRIPQEPSRSEAEAALGRMEALLTEFPFATPADRSAALALFLTAACRSSLETAPGFLANAHAPGSGKSYLLAMGEAFATSGIVASATYKSANDEEMEKILVAALLASPPAIRFDELTGDLSPVKSILTLLSAPQLAGRLLGLSKMVTPSTRCLVTFAGNNTQPLRDMVRRVVVINLDVQVENPESRAFDRDQLTHLREHRAEFVADALTIIRAKILANPELVKCRPLNGFDRWNQWVRQSLLWLGLPDPCDPMFAKATEDPDRELLAAVHEAWWQTFGDSPASIRMAIDRASADDTGNFHRALCEICRTKGNELDATRIGLWVKRHVGRIVKGRRFERDNSVARSVAWYCIPAFTTIVPEATTGESSVTGDPLDISDLL
jgi:hypothetical protein